MAITATIVASSFWTDFSAVTLQAITPSQAIPAGDRVFFIQGTTVDGGVAPNVVNWGGLDDYLYDSAGNVFNRDNYGGPVNLNNVSTTVEIWSSFVKYGVPTSGYGLVALPDVRGLSSWWILMGVNGLGESSGASPFDATAAFKADLSGTTWTLGPTAALIASHEWCVAAYSIAGAPTAPWFTDTAGFTSISQQSGASPGSSRGLAVLTKEVFTSAAVTDTGTIGSATLGAGALSTYKVEPSPSVLPDPIVLVQHTTAQTSAGLSQAATFASTTAAGNMVLVAASVWKSGGADQTPTCADNNGTVFTAVQATAPATTAGARCYLWYGKNIAGRAGHQVTVTCANSSFITVSISEWNGADISAPLDKVNKATGTGTAVQPGSVTPSVPGELCVMVATEDTGSTYMNTRAWVKLDDIITGQDLHVQWAVLPNAAVNPSISWTIGSDAWAALIGTFRPGPSPQALEPNIKAVYLGAKL